MIYIGEIGNDFFTAAYREYTNHRAGSQLNIINTIFNVPAVYCTLVGLNFSFNGSSHLVWQYYLI